MTHKRYLNANMKFATLALILCFSAVISYATICKPFSAFKIDCNVCKCSQTGREYSCSKKVCIPEEFSEEVSDNGYVLIKPKKPQNFDEDYSDYVLINKKRHPRMPYLDEVPIELGAKNNGKEEGNLKKFNDVGDEEQVENLELFD